MRRTAFSITIDPNLYQLLKDTAAAENRTLSNLIESIIKWWLDNKEK